MTLNDMSSETLQITQPTSKVEDTIENTEHVFCCQLPIGFSGVATSMCLEQHPTHITGEWDEGDCSKLCARCEEVAKVYPCVGYCVINILTNT